MTFCVLVYWLSIGAKQVFLYCDKKFVAQNELPGICEVCDHLFRDKVSIISNNHASQRRINDVQLISILKVVLAPSVERKLRAALVFAVKQRRKGLKSDQGSLKLSCQMLVELQPDGNVYEDIFESEFLHKTREYYTVLFFKAVEFGH